MGLRMGAQDAGRLSPARLPLGARGGLVLRLAATGYVAVASLHAELGRGLRVWAFTTASLVLCAASTRWKRRASSLSFWGTSVVLASVGSSHAGPWVRALGILGALVASTSACFAVAQMTSDGPAAPGWGEGALVPQRPSSPAPAAAMVLLVWGLALAGAVGAAIGVRLDLERFASPCAGAAALLILTAVVARTARTRRLVLGVADRARAATEMSAVCTLLLLGVALTRLDAADVVLRLGAAAAAAIVAHVALHGDAVRITQTWRRAIVVTLVGGPFAMLGVIAVEGAPWDAPAVVLLVAASAALLGTLAPRLDRPLRPAEGAWLDAMANAGDRLLHAAPDTAIREALSELRRPAGSTGASPELWSLDPMRVLTVDAAGYSRERASELPDKLLAIAAEEPGATLRTEVLEALEVRRPDLRGLVRWMVDRGALSATVVAAGGDPKGLLILPRGSRAAPLTLEEVRCLKQLADSFGAACEAGGALHRSRAREEEARARAESAEERALRLERAIALEAGHHVRATMRAARPATVGVYSAASRSALEALERRMQAGAPVAVVAPSGVDPVPYLARAHLGGPRREGPLVLVDGTSSREHDLERWRDAMASPLALADGGLLVLLDGAALPPDVQRLVAQALAERRPPWERPDPLAVALAFTATRPPRDREAAGRLDAALAARLGDAADSPIALPRLRDRAEDVRALLTDRLAREGLRARGAPVGLDDAAFALLAEYPFPGEDAELAAIVQRLVASAPGDVIRAADVEALGLPPAPPEAPPGEARARLVRGGGTDA